MAWIFRRPFDSVPRATKSNLPPTDVTVALSGVSATGVVGAIGLSIALTFSGVSASASAGQVIPDGSGTVSITLAGQGGVGLVGSAGLNSAPALLGVAGDSDVGLVSPNIATPLSGNSATGLLSEEEQVISIAIAGNSAAGLVGAIVRNAVVEILGNSTTGLIGDLSSGYYNVAWHINGPGFAIGDLLLAQRLDWDASRNPVTLYRIEARVVEVTSGGEAIIQITSGLDAFIANGDQIEFVRVGNLTDANRQGLIWMTSSGEHAPAIDIINGVNSLNSALATGLGNVNTLKVRIGNLSGITDDNFGIIPANTHGIYTNFGYFKGYVAVGSATALGVGTGVWLDRNGSIRFGNIATNKYIKFDVSTGETTLGSAVALQWARKSVV